MDNQWTVKVVATKGEAEVEALLMGNSDEPLSEIYKRLAETQKELEEQK